MKELLLRSVSGVLYISIVILTLFTSHKWFITLFLILGLIALFEFLRLIRFNSLVHYLFLIILIYFFSYREMEPVWVYLFLACTLIVNLILLIRLFISKVKPHKNPFVKFLNTVFYLIGGFVFLTLIPGHGDSFEPWVIFGIFLLVWSNDTFAYLIGKSMGKRKLFKSVSPNKTIEGFFGGLIGTVIISFIIFKYTLLFNFGIWMTMAILVTVFGTLGDLIQSRFKRNAGVKDSGIMMPGHGGLYDRLDSILFASPVLFTFLEIVNYVS